VSGVVLAVLALGGAHHLRGHRMRRILCSIHCPLPLGVPAPTDSLTTFERIRQEGLLQYRVSVICKDSPLHQHGLYDFQWRTVLCWIFKFETEFQDPGSKPSIKLLNTVLNESAKSINLI
jgi:hypothetical protein